MSLLESEDLRRWHDNLARGSAITAEVYVRRLRLFCDQSETTFQGLVSYLDEGWEIAREFNSGKILVRKGY